MGVRGMQSHETFPCVTDGRVYERELGKVWQSILASNNMRLEFYSRDKSPFMHDYKIPVLFRPIIARQGCIIQMDGTSRNSFTLNESGKKQDETVHLFAASDQCSVASVLLAAPSALCIAL